MSMPLKQYKNTKTYFLQKLGNLKAAVTTKDGKFENKK